MSKPVFTYAIYMATTTAKAWNALIDPKLTAQYWQHVNESDWRPGSKWAHRRTDEARTVDLIGKVIESAPPSRLVLSWAAPEDENREEGYSRVTFAIEPYRDVVRLIVTHDRLEPDSEMLEGITDGWPKVLSSMKTLLETGHALPMLW